MVCGKKKRGATHSVLPAAGFQQTAGMQEARAQTRGRRRAVSRTRGSKKKGKQHCNTLPSKPLFEKNDARPASPPALRPPTLPAAPSRTPSQDTRTHTRGLRCGRCPPTAPPTTQFQMSWLAAQAPRAEPTPLTGAKPPPPGVSSTAAADAARLSMYGEAPRGDVAVEEFERAALDRLKGRRRGGGEAGRGRVSGHTCVRRCGDRRLGGRAGRGTTKHKRRCAARMARCDQKTSPSPSLPLLSPQRHRGCQGQRPQRQPAGRESWVGLCGEEERLHSARSLITSLTSPPLSHRPPPSSSRPSISPPPSTRCPTLCCAWPFAAQRSCAAGF